MGLLLPVLVALLAAQGASAETPVQLSTGKLPAARNDYQPTNSFPIAFALSPDRRYAALLNNGYGTYAAEGRQSISIVDLDSGVVSDFPDDRLGPRSHQTYFLGVAFSSDGKFLYASISSISDPEGKEAGDTGNGIAVYSFTDGKLWPTRFIPIPLLSLPGDTTAAPINRKIQPDHLISYPAGLAVVRTRGGDRLLLAGNLADSALLMDPGDGRVIHRFDLSTTKVVPGSYPYAVAASKDGRRAWVSLWNASRVAELDLEDGSLKRMIPLGRSRSAIAPGSHPNSLLLNDAEDRLYVTLANRDQVAVVATATGRVLGRISTRLPGQNFGGSYPSAMAFSGDGRQLFIANSGSNTVEVVDLFVPGSTRRRLRVRGFIPTEWYPRALLTAQDRLWVACAKGAGAGPNAMWRTGKPAYERHHQPFVFSLLHGSLTAVDLGQTLAQLPELTKASVKANRTREESAHKIKFARGRNPIRHVIYILKENRSYDQLFGDMEEGNGDPSLVMYGKEITPNQHKLAREFGLLDNFYDSGEVSGDGHNWSTAATASDYVEDTIQVQYRGRERTYDYEGMVANRIPLEDDMADVAAPGTNYLWTLAARRHLTYRHYGEFIATLWCAERPGWSSPELPKVRGNAPPCARDFIQPGEAMPQELAGAQGVVSPWPWPVPLVRENVATKPELRGHFDPRFPDFELSYPDQLRADEFLREFTAFVEARKSGHGDQLPNYVLLRLPDDHTSGTRPGFATPSAAVADNDLAVGRVVEAVSHSPYWDDTAIMVIEDDAQDGPDHVDAHRSIALVISKYSPSKTDHVFVDSNFYTTVSMLRTLETLLGLPPMNQNDAQAPVISSMFEGDGTHPAFDADYSNRDNGLIYKMNPAGGEGARESEAMDFTHADSADAAALNRILWRERMGNVPYPEIKHRFECRECATFPGRN